MVNQVFDYLITIEDEVRWVWGGKWDTTRVIFTVSRYVPFVGTGLMSYCVPFDSPSAPCATGLETTAIIIHIIGVVAAELLLILRTYALWLGDKRILYGLLACIVVAACAAIALYTSPMQFLTGGQPQIGCLLESPRNSALVYAILLLYELAFLHQESSSICAKASIILSWANESAPARERNGLETQHNASLASTESSRRNLLGVNLIGIYDIDDTY
ncbi:hypothetical protein BU15DRAFT_76452 [Melanogaster broomeanus]|nr:hypothetical protein BU15DRAFT_76452 [Melanogaster broomeanus]